MKGFVFAFALLAITASAFAEPPPDLKGFFDDCKTKIGITEAMPPRSDDDDSKAKCFHACVLKKSGHIVGGKLILEKELEFASKMLDMDDAKKATLTECVNTANTESDECNVAHAMAKCLKSNNLLPPLPPRPPMH